MIKEINLWCNIVYLSSFISIDLIIVLLSLWGNEYGIRDPNISIKETMKRLTDDIYPQFINVPIVCIIFYIAPLYIFIWYSILIIKTVINALFYIPFKEEDKEKEEN